MKRVCFSECKHWGQQSIQDDFKTFAAMWNQSVVHLCEQAGQPRLVAVYHVLAKPRKEVLPQLVEEPACVDAPNEVQGNCVLEDLYGLVVAEDGAVRTGSDCTREIILGLPPEIFQGSRRLTHEVLDTSATSRSSVDGLCFSMREVSNCQVSR